MSESDRIRTCACCMHANYCMKFGMSIDIYMKSCIPPPPPYDFQNSSHATPTWHVHMPARAEKGTMRARNQLIYSGFLHQSMPIACAHRATTAMGGLGDRGRRCRCHRRPCFQGGVQGEARAHAKCKPACPRHAGFILLSMRSYRGQYLPHSGPYMPCDVPRTAKANS